MNIIFLIFQFTLIYSNWGRYAPPRGSRGQDVPLFGRPRSRADDNPFHDTADAITQIDMLLRNGGYMVIASGGYPYDNIYAENGKLVRPILQQHYKQIVSDQLADEAPDEVYQK